MTTGFLTSDQMRRMQLDLINRTQAILEACDAEQRGPTADETQALRDSQELRATLSAEGDRRHRFMTQLLTGART